MAETKEVSCVFCQRGKLRMVRIILLLLIMYPFAGCNKKEIKPDIQLPPVVQPPATEQPQTELPQNQQTNIIIEEGKIVFNTESNNPIEIPIINKKEEKEVDTPNYKGPVGYTEITKAYVSDNGEYAGVYHYQSEYIDEMGESTTTFKYYNKNGKLLWENSDEIPGPDYVSISGDGKIIFLQTTKYYGQRWKEDIRYCNVLYNEKGEIIWDFGEFDDLGTIYITKNGKYGYYQYKDKNYEQAHMFFDVQNKKTNSYSAIAYAEISNEGKARLYNLDIKIIDSTKHPFVVEEKETTVYEFSF